MRKNLGVNMGFTLAEVLITLGIVGVVAVMTIPSLINNYKTKELEIRFKDADSIIQQALKRTANEAGYDSISDLNIPGRTVTDENLSKLKKEVSETLNPIWLKQFTNITPLTWSSTFWGGKKCHGMGGGVFHMFEQCWFSYGDNKAYQLPNGLTVTGLSAQYGGVNHPGLVYLLFDTNGPYQGPNRWGHDIFLYYSSSNYNTMCNPTIKNSGNQTGCYYWANKNQNPKDKTTPYWKILYKPLSYWQNN